MYKFANKTAGKGWYYWNLFLCAKHNAHKLKKLSTISQSYPQTIHILIHIKIKDKIF